MKENILSFVQSKGPSLPNDIAREFKVDTVLAGAMLSDLVSEKQLKISSLRIGSSPLYYAKGQEQKLEAHKNHLNEKDRRAFELLSEKKILRDTEQTPLVRIALRSIKDFAVPLQVNTNPPTLFWKFYSLTAEEAEKLIRQELEPKKTEPIKTIQKTTKEPETKEKTPTKKEEPKEPEKKEKKETQTKIKKEISKDLQTDDFFSLLQKYFTDNNIEIISSEKLCKTEYDLVIKVPSMVGKLEYFCKAKKKKRCNDGDLSSAYVQGQLKKLPTLFLTNGTLTKKAQAMLDKEFKNSVMYKQI